LQSKSFDLAAKRADVGQMPGPLFFRPLEERFLLGDYSLKLVQVT
jgi:hypothetical protein